MVNCSKYKKIILIIILILILFGSVIIYYINKYIKEQNLNLDLKELNEQIYDIGDYSQISMIDIDKYYLKDKLQIEEEEIEEYIGKVPLVNIKSSMYLIMKTNPSNTNQVLKKVQKYGESLENEWQDYLAEQYYIVKDRKVGKIGQYVYIIVSYDVDEILDNINKKVEK